MKRLQSLNIASREKNPDLNINNHLQHQVVNYMCEWALRVELFLQKWNEVWYHRYMCLAIVWTILWQPSFSVPIMNPSFLELKDLLFFQRSWLLGLKKISRQIQHVNTLFSATYLSQNGMFPFFSTRANRGDPTILEVVSFDLSASS